MNNVSKLPIEATEIFCRLIELLDKQDRASESGYMKLKREGFMPLSMERLYSGIGTPWGTATCYSLAHTFVQNGDLMRDPEMTFLVVDNRNGKDDFRLVGIYPESYQMDGLGLYQECLFTENRKLARFAPDLMRSFAGLPVSGWTTSRRRDFSRRNRLPDTATPYQRCHRLPAFVAGSFFMEPSPN
jgi:hypothetical protein